MTNDLLIWCRDDSPHGEHWRQNAFNGRDYCSGRPAPKPEPADLLDEAARDTCYSDECGEPCQSWQAMKRAELAEYKRQAESTGRRLGEARGKLDKVREALTGRAPHSQVARDVLAILDDQTGVGGTGCASLIE